MTRQEGIQLIRTASIDEVESYGRTPTSDVLRSKQQQRLVLKRRDFVKLASVAGLGVTLGAHELLFPQPAEANLRNLINVAAEALRLLREVFKWGKPVQGEFTVFNPYNEVRQGIVVVYLYQRHTDWFTRKVTYVRDGQYLATSYTLYPGERNYYSFDKMPTSKGDKIVQVQTRVSKLEANCVVA